MRAFRLRAAAFLILSAGLPLPPASIKSARRAQAATTDSDILAAPLLAAADKLPDPPA